MRKIFIALFISVGMLFSCNAGVYAENAGVSVSAQSAVVIEMQTGKVLYEKNAYEKRPVASTTKIMTTLLTLESGNLDEPFIVDPNAIKVEGSSMGLQEGDTVTKRILCYGMLLPSGNDAANSAAIKLAGSFEAFSEMMNAKAKDIGMSSTYFVTPSGLDAKGHGASAYDMALLTREAMKNPDFREICLQSTAKLSYGNPPYDRWLKNTNKLLNMYEGCIGVKTGFTDDAGRCLVSAAQRDGVTLIAVTLKAPDDWSDHRVMFNSGFSRLKQVVFPNPLELNSIPLVGGIEDNAAVTFGKDSAVPIVDGDENKLSYKVIIDNFVYAPIQPGYVVGKVEYYYENQKISETNITIANEYKIKPLEEKTDIFKKIRLLFTK